MRRNKTRAIFFIFLFSLFLLFAGCAKKEIANIDSQGENIICLGDSITFGYGVAPGEDYPTLLSPMLSRPVINAGVDGDTSVDALKRIDADVLSKNPVLVIIEFGGNDFIKKIPLAETVENVREIASKVQAQGGMVAIADISAGMFLKDYRSAFSRLAKEKQAIFIPGVLSGIITNPNLKSDFMHPNSEGYRIVAQRIYRVIAPYLYKNLLKRKLAKE